MDKKAIKGQLIGLIDDSDYIYFASIMAYDKNYFRNEGGEAQTFAERAYEEIEDPHGDYYAWYGIACKVIQILAPDNLQDFQSFFTNYIQNWLINPEQGGHSEYLFQKRFNNFESGFRTQRRILKAIRQNADHALFNLESEIQHRVYKSEMEIAQDLKKQKYLRAAGAIAGVILEVHLKNVVINKGIMPKKKNPGISDYNEALKDAKAYEVATWRQVQMCGDIRNKCVHPKETEPTGYEIDTIISSAEIIIATVN